MLQKSTRRLLSILWVILLSLTSVSASDYVSLCGSVVESLAHSPLYGARVALLDSGYLELDTAIARQKMQGIGTMPAEFNLRCNKTPGIYYLMIECDGYDPLVTPLDYKRFGSRETFRDLGQFILRKSPKQLDEVTVTASRIKFYNKGDTLVFNAAAFQLAEGSMLDALVNQLPGVEMTDDGNIYVNGKFVSDLLLDGKDFFKGRSNILLENLGAYTVKDIAVYERAGDLSEFLGKDANDKELVMDVRLKKEYRQGFMANIEGGYGTDSRYIGRLFGMRYTTLSQIGIYANINNLNDAQRPDKTKVFDPAKMLQGVRREQKAGLTFNTQTADNNFNIEGNLDWTRSTVHDDASASRINFLPGGNTYDYSFRNSKNVTNSLYGYTRLSSRRKNDRTSATLRATYLNNESASSSTGAAFSTERADVTRQLIEEIYGSGGDLTDIINRSISLRQRKGHQFKGSVFLDEQIKVPYTTDALIISFDGRYGERRDRGFNSYLINTGSDAVPTNSEGQWTDTRPNRDYSLCGQLRYTYIGNSIFLHPKYYFTHARVQKNMVTCIIDHLADNDVYGLDVPAEALYSPDDSYYSTQLTNTHELSLEIRKIIAGLRLSGEIGLKAISDNLWYDRGNNRYRSSRKTVVPMVKDLGLVFGFGKYKGRYGMIERNTFELKYNLQATTPKPEWLLPVTDTTDPLFIYTGAEELRNQLNHDIRLMWSYSPQSIPLKHTATASAQIVDNMLVRGVTYNRETGVSTVRSYNTDGNRNFELSSILSLQFGPRKVLTLANTATFGIGEAADITGTEAAAPQQFSIHNTLVSDNLKLTWQIGRQSVGVKGDVSWRHTTSAHDDFNDFNAATINYGLTGLFRLPANFGLSTDLTLYTRRGYGDRNLNRTDLVWNARLTYSLMKGRLVFMADGFDMLHQLSNIVYDVNARGRTVTYYNVVPRFVLFHAVYKFDIKPQKK